MAAIITPIEPAEIPALLELIRELAVFERLEHEMQATEELLRESFFGQNAVASALVARENGELAGYAIYFFTFSSFLGRRGVWLDDLYVRPPFRRRGLGRALMEAVAQIAAKNNCGRYEWSALNWNQNALEVYRKMGAKVMEEWVLLRVNADGIQKLAAKSPLARASGSQALRNTSQHVGNDEGVSDFFAETRPAPLSVECILVTPNFSWVVAGGSDALTALAVSLARFLPGGAGKPLKRFIAKSSSSSPN